MKLSIFEFSLLVLAGACISIGAGIFKDWLKYKIPKSFAYWGAVLFLTGAITSILININRANNPEKSSKILDSLYRSKIDTQKIKNDDNVYLDSMIKMSEQMTKIIDSSLQNLKKNESYCDYIIAQLGFSATVPNGYVSSRGSNLDSEKCSLINVSVKIGSKQVSIFSVMSSKDTIKTEGQKAHLRGFFDHFLIPPEKKVGDKNYHEDAVYDNQFHQQIIDKNKFWFINIERHYDKLIVKQKIFCGFVKNYFVTMLVNVFTQQQMEDCEKLIDSIIFDGD